MCDGYWNSEGEKKDVLLSNVTIDVETEKYMIISAGHQKKTNKNKPKHTAHFFLNLTHF